MWYFFQIVLTNKQAKNKLKQNYKTKEQGLNHVNSDGLNWHNLYSVPRIILYFSKVNCQQNLHRNSTIWLINLLQKLLVKTDYL